MAWLWRVLAVVLLCSVSAPAVRAQPQADALRAAFAAPPVSARPMTRWWWPGAAVSPDEIRREIAVLDAAGFGGGEVQPFIAEWPTMTSQEQAAMNAYPSEGYFENVAAAAQAAQARGMRVDSTFGSGWPTGGEAITPALASLELTMTHIEVEGGRSRTLRLPMPPRTPRIGAMMERLPGAPQLSDAERAALDARGRVIAVVAVRGSAPTTSPYRENSPLTGAAWPSVTQSGRLQAGSTLVLTGRLHSDGLLDWHAPAGTWQVFVFKQYAADIRVLGGVGHGAQLVADHLNPAAFDAHAAHVGEPLMAHVRPSAGRGFGSIFIDSLELPADLFWSENFLAEFKRRRGYDLTPHLPLVVQPGWRAAYSSQVSLPMYDMDEIGARVRADYRQTVSDLMIDYFYQRAVNWAHQNGVTARIQAHGMPGDVLAAYGAADIPETEDMSGGRDQNFLRVARSAADIYGHRLVSAESFATPSKPYAFSPENLKRWSDALFAGGVNQIWMHGFAYSFHADEWPGWYPFATSEFSPGFSSMINEANPQWPVMARLNAYIARMQEVLQNTQNVAPVAIYNDSTLEAPGGGETAALGDALRKAGYDYDHLNGDGILRSHLDAGRMVTPGGARFAAIVLPNVAALDAETAEHLAQFARGGVKIFVLGAAPDRAEGLFDARRRDVRVREAVRAMAVRQVADAATLVTALRNEKIAANVTFLNGRVADFIEKRDGARRIYFMRTDNEAGAIVSFVTDAAGGAFLWDAWTGEVAPLPVRTVSGGVQVDLNLPRFGAALIVFDADAPRRAAYERAAVVARELGLGARGWRFHADGHSSSTAQHALIRPSMALRDWREIPGLDRFAGVGTYETNFPLGLEWLGAGKRVSLDLGEVFDSAIVRVNGVTFAPLIVRPFVLDVTEAVSVGQNHLEIAVMNAPHNALAPLRTDQPQRGLQPAGLMGPVRLREMSRQGNATSLP